MKTRTLLWGPLWTLFVAGILQAQVIVANNNVKISEIKKSDVHDIFTGASNTFGNGARAVPATLKSGPIHDEFLKEFIGKNDTAFRAAWRALVFSGQGTMPQSFDTEAELLDYVASKPGAIGYVGPSTTSDKVKTLPIK